METKEYRISSSILVLYLIIDFLLMAVAIGFITGIYHIVIYLTQKLILTPTHVVIKTGVFGSNEHEIPYRMINSISVKQGVWGKSFGFGTIAIMAGNDSSGLPFKGVDKPQEIKNEINRRIAKLHESPAPSQSTSKTPYEQLEKLAELRDKGVITSEDYEAKKKQLLEI